MWAYRQNFLRNQSSTPPPTPGIYLGIWNAATNDQGLVNGVGDLNSQFIVAVPGTVDFGAGPISFNVGDFTVFNGTIWTRLAAGSPNPTIIDAGSWSPSINIPPLSDSTPAAIGTKYTATDIGTIDFGTGDPVFGVYGTPFVAGDYVIFNGYNWQMVPKGIGTPFELVVNTSYSADVELPFTQCNYLTVNWGDGITEVITTGAPFTHTYGSTATFTVTVHGHSTKYSTTFTPASQLPIVAVNSFGTYGLANMRVAFSGAVNLTTVPTYLPPSVKIIDGMLEHATAFNQNISAWNTINVTSMYGLFYGATLFNLPLNTWNTSNITEMGGVFDGATVFNQPLSSWNTSKVTNMGGMFENAFAFNQDISMWDTSKVTNMLGMFHGANMFNQPLNSWNTSSVTNMSMMFWDAWVFNRPLNSWNTGNVTNMDMIFFEARAFNQPLNSWNVSNVTSMSGSFLDARAFNQPLNSWNISKVTYMPQMFTGATLFNQPLSSWDVSNVTNMVSLFRDTAFNQDISMWDVSKSTDMRQIFYRTPFNHPLNSWNTSSATLMSDMFGLCSAFNQPLNLWNTSNVTDMAQMFDQATSFNQNISSWNVHLIPTLPLNFAQSGPLSLPANFAKLPHWGV